MDDARRPVDLDRRPVGLHGGELAAGDGSTKWRGTPMDDALRPVDLDRRPVALHGGDLAAGDAPQQLDISQTHPCEWRTDKQEAVGHFSFLAAIALTEPVASTAARSWPARDAY